MTTALSINRVAVPRTQDDVDHVLANPGFAMYPTEHMVTARWAGGHWAEFAVHPFQSIVIDPRAMALHYGQAIFEGMKAFAQPDGSVAVFRPEQNAMRFARSAERMSMPPLSVEQFVDACDALIAVDRRWVPTMPGTSLYLRPFMFASEAHVGVRSAVEFEFLVLALPAAPFFSADFQPIKVGVLDQYVRASRGGTGEAKCAGNYAASLRAKREAATFGCSEVLWLDANEHRFVEELSGMNVFFVERQGDRVRLLTPSLQGTILRGITRESLLLLAPALGLEVEERPIDIDEVEERAAKGEIVEAFACGTAAVIAPISGVAWPHGREIHFGTGTAGKVTTQLYSELIAIQEGRSTRFADWRHAVEGAVVEAGPTPSQ